MLLPERTTAGSCVAMPSRMISDAFSTLEPRLATLRRTGLHQLPRMPSVELTPGTAESAPRSVAAANLPLCSAHMMPKTRDAYRLHQKPVELLIPETGAHRAAVIRRMSAPMTRPVATVMIRTEKYLPPRQPTVE